MIVLLKTNNLNMCLYHEYLKTLLQKIFEDNYRNLHSETLMSLKSEKN